MPTITVTANKLNQRKGPVADTADKSNIVGEVFAGYSFESQGTVTNSLGIWYKDINGYYYWGKGVSEAAAQQSAAGNIETTVVPSTNWNASLANIPASLAQTQGKNVKIAIIDSGAFAAHESLSGAIIYQDDFTTIKDNIAYDGHGTHIAGIIGGRSGIKEGIRGVAPCAELIILKVIFDSLDTAPGNDQYLVDALDKAIEKGADIINISLDISKPSAALKTKIAEVAGMNIVIVAAAGDNEDLKDGQLFFPAIMKQVVSVAAINEGYFLENPGYNKDLNIIAPITDYRSSFIAPGLYKSMGGCSMSAAFISGIIALVISSKRTTNERYQKAEILSSLATFSLPIDAMDYNDTEKFYFNLSNHS